MVEAIGRLESGEFSYQDPIERFNQLLAGLETHLTGDNPTGLRNTPIVPTGNGDIRFGVFIPRENTLYSPSITCQTMIEKQGAEGSFMAPESTIHLKLRHLDGSLGNSVQEDVDAAPQRLQELEQALAAYEAAKSPLA